jgi:hypothetical protein
MPGSAAFACRGSPPFPFDRDAGASPLFPPHYQQNEEAKEALLHVVRRDPHQFGIDRARWTHQDLLQVCDWLRLQTAGGLSHLLDRLGIHYKRGRDYVHSPDPDYLEKLRDVDRIVELARASFGRIVALYQDELTYYRQPTLASAYETAGPCQPLARRSHQANTATRIAGALNLVDGRVYYRQSSHTDVRELVRFYHQIREAYPQAERIYLIQDNWPVHFHPDLLVALAPQESRWPMYRPQNWSEEPSAKARKQWEGLCLPIQLVPLPTYASWTNPIEKLWRWLRQDVLHLHRLAGQLPRLREAVSHFLDRFAFGSQELLHYVGLLVPV